MLCIIGRHPLVVEVVSQLHSTDRRRTGDLFFSTHDSDLAKRSAVPELPGEVVKLLFKNACKSGCSNEEIAFWKSKLKYEIHDLNSDAVPEFFLFIEHSDWCGAGGNCDYWVFQKKENKYALILNDKVIRIKNTITNGYRDLTSETPIGFCERNVQRLYVTPYKFDGKKYRVQSRRTECKVLTSPITP